jgi:primosomal replication protein N
MPHSRELFQKAASCSQGNLILAIIAAVSPKLYQVPRFEEEIYGTKEEHKLGRDTFITLSVCVSSHQINEGLESISMGSGLHFHSGLVSSHAVLEHQRGYFPPLNSKVNLNDSRWLS